MLDYLTGRPCSRPQTAEDRGRALRCARPQDGRRRRGHYSLLTNYELGLVKMLPIPLHLALDAASGVLLASSPWLFGFASKGSRYWLPHALVGATGVLAAVTSKTR